MTFPGSYDGGRAESSPTASLGRHRARVLACVKALLSAPTPLRGATALTPAPHTLIQMVLGDDAHSCAPTVEVPITALLEAAAFEDDTPQDGRASRPGRPGVWLAEWEAERVKIAILDVPS